MTPNRASWAMAMKRFFNEEPEDDGPAKKQVFDKGKARSVSTPVVSQGFSLDLSAGLPDVQEVKDTCFDMHRSLLQVSHELP